MPLQVGIVGLPNVGKSTLFSAITKQAVPCENFPFCTVDPNVGVVRVPDDRLDRLAAVSKPKKIIPTTVEFVDIAGLVKGASEGHGLGNKFLSHIRECHAIVQVARAFQDENVIHVDGAIDPLRDAETIATELALADLETVAKRFTNVKSNAKAGMTRELEKELAALQRAKDALEKGEQLRELVWNEDELKVLKSFSPLTLKPMIYVLNVSEGQLKDKAALGLRGPMVRICVKMEAELAALSEPEKKEYLVSVGEERSGLDRLILETYRALDLITFLTSGPDETRAWAVRAGTKAPQAGSAIHTDFEKKFIRVEVTNWQDFVKYGGEVGCREKGLVRIEGKDYVIQDGDVCYFRIGG